MHRLFFIVGGARRTLALVSNLDKLKASGFVKMPSRGMWVNRKLRMAFSYEAVEDIKPAWLDAHLAEDVYEHDFVFFFSKVPENTQVCNEILKELGVRDGRVHANIRKSPCTISSF